MPKIPEHAYRNLRCQWADHPFGAKIWQSLHTIEETGEITNVTTMRGGMYGVKCSVCGSLPKDPNA